MPVDEIIRKLLKRRPWVELALVLWTLLMLGVILVAVSPSPASRPAPKVAAVTGEVRPPEPVRPPAPLPEERVTFRERWSPVSLPALPATLVTPVALIAPPPMRPVREPEQTVQTVQTVRTVQNVQKARGVCERHGLRKIWVNDRRWRCRR